MFKGYCLLKMDYRRVRSAGCKDVKQRKPENYVNSVRMWGYCGFAWIITVKISDDFHLNEINPKKYNYNIISGKQSKTRIDTKQQYNFH